LSPPTAIRSAIAGVRERRVRPRGVFRLSSDWEPESSVGLQTAGRTLGCVEPFSPPEELLMYDLAAFAIGAACFAFAFLMLWVLSRV